MRYHRVPIVNRGPHELQVGLEPEGDCLTLSAGESLEIRYSTEDKLDELVVELELEGQLLSVHCMSIKEVWKNGGRIR
jgi:hypothetical protein